MRNKQSVQDHDVEALYHEYPRKAARGAAIRAIRKALHRESFQVLWDAVTEFADTWEGASVEDKKFCPHASTWFNQERWDDDREEWWAAKRDRERSSKKHHDFDGLKGFLDEE